VTVVDAGGGPVGGGDRAGAVAEAGAVLIEAGVGEDGAAGHLEPIGDRAAPAHARDGDIDVIVLDALPAREREAVSRVHGLDRSMQAVGAAHAAVLPLGAD